MAEYLRLRVPGGILAARASRASKGDKAVLMASLGCAALVDMASSKIKVPTCAKARKEASRDLTVSRHVGKIILKAQNRTHNGDPPALRF